MKMITWNCQGAGNVAFRDHAYELHRRHRPQILTIVESHIAEERAQVVIETLSYTHFWRVDPTSSFGGIWMLWKESNDLKVEILINSEYNIYALKNTVAK